MITPFITCIHNRSSLLVSVTPFLLFAFIITTTSVAQDSTQNYFTDDRVNACFSALHPATGEALCLYYNHTFRYYIGYGGKDQVAYGTYGIQRDTFFLTGNAASSFTIKASSNPVIPKGKIKIQFKDLANQARFVAIRFNSNNYKYASKLASAKNVYHIITERPGANTIELAYNRYFDKQERYELAKDKNDFTVSLSDSFSQIDFESQIYIWEGSSLRPVAAGYDKGLLELSGGSGIDYNDIPWKNGKPEITEDAFNKWSKVQEQGFQKRATHYAGALAKKKQVQQEMMQRHFASGWEEAMQNAKADTAEIIAMFGPDSLLIENTNKPADNDTPVDAANGKAKLLRDIYYKKFQLLAAGNQNLYGSRERTAAVPFFYQSNKTDDSIKEKFGITVLPAIVIAASDGTPLFKTEGDLADAEQLYHIYNQVMEQQDIKFSDSVIASYNVASKDSGYLAGIIRLMATTNAKRRQLLEDGGITTGNIMDKLVAYFISRRPYSATVYDIVHTSYFPKGREWENLLRGFETESGAISPAVVWLIDHFADRQRDTNFYNKDINDSLIIAAHSHLIGWLDASFVSGPKSGFNNLDLQKLNKKMATGHTRYLDLYTDLAYLFQKLRWIEFEKKPLDNNYENELTGFLNKYAGEPFSKSSIADSATSFYRAIVRDNNKFFLETYLSEIKPGEYLVHFKEGVGYMATILAITKMTATGDSLLSAAVIKKAGILSLLEMLVYPDNDAAICLFKRNYAYVLYQLGATKNAISLLEDLQKWMNDTDNPRLKDEAKQKLKRDLVKMKAGGKLNFRILNLLAL